MTAPRPDQQADLEQMVTRMARRAADAVSQSVADLGVQLALARESLDGMAAALAEKDRQLAEKDAELARAHQLTEQQAARIADLDGV